MTERGRPAASEGNAYQDVRVALCLIDLLEDASFTSVAVETLDATDDLVVRRQDGRVRYEQVKERAPRGSWTAQGLVNEGVLGQFVQQNQIDPDGELVLFTGSDASDFREVSERARNASANHPRDEPGRQAAHAEWEVRLAGRRNFVDQMLGGITATDDRYQSLTLRDLFQVLACVRVVDASGGLDQVRHQAMQRLRPLADEPTRALQILEDLARDAAIRRGVIRRRDVENALERGGAGPRFDAFALAIDAAAYAEKIANESMAVDVAKLRPLVPTFDLPSGVTFGLEGIHGKTVLIGGHGAGKSRIAADLALKTLQSGRRCLYIRLARWATSLIDLLVAELSVAAKRRARVADVADFLTGSGALVLDGLDEVPAAQRLTAEREILQFADAHPHLDILVTRRPGCGRALSEQWPDIHVRPLNREQIEEALGQGLHGLHLPESIVILAGNPLMLGLLARSIASGGRPTGEADLLDAFVAEAVQRESQRTPSVDRVSGLRLAEDIAFEWLSSGRVALDPDQLRSVAASVALGLRQTALLQTDAVQVEHWLIEAGLGVMVDAVVVPVHRAVLDHLAGRSMGRRDAIQSASRPELREAVARYLGSQAAVSDSMLALLNAVGTDLELLARGRQLTSAEIVWPFGPERFATEYLTELRRLGNGPLIDIGVVGHAVEIDVDKDITWISERTRADGNDVTNIVDVPNRPYISTPGGSTRSPVQAISFGSFRGAEVDVRVPHFAAFARAGAELQQRLRSRALPNEGPDIVYERLCALTKRFVRTVTRVGMSEYQGFSDADFRGLTASGLQEKFLGYVTELSGVEVANNATGSVLIAFVPHLQKVVVATGPEAMTETPGSALGVHGAALVRLVARATELGIHQLPLHPLSLLPESASDPILALPSRMHLLHGDSLSLFVLRHEIGEARAFRHLVEHNLHGFARLLPTYATLPWRIELAVQDESTPTTFDAHIRSMTRIHASIDEVVIVQEFPAADSLWVGSSSIHAYRGVLNGAYDLVDRDVRSLLSGTDPLGSDVL